ncbi:MAG: ribosome maturation factor RimP [Desulfohalobiaceae bacterium]|nr:ribosome maturation factor RimP [Desulfohalobiaceae bacterium]
MSDKQYQRILDLVEPLVQTMGLTLWGIELPSAPKGGTLRIYVDTPQGVSIDQCRTLSKHLSLVFDVDDPFPGGSYTLEVSSPGLERPFFEPGQLDGYQGRKIALTLKEPVNNSKKWQGELLRVNGNTVTLQTETREMDFDWDQIRRAHLIHEEPVPSRKQKK